MKLDIKERQPKFGGNYKPGYVGFTFTDNSFISSGIIFFTNKPTSTINVSHTFLVDKDGTGLEATLTKGVNGVRRFRLDEYFNNPHTHVLFKKPYNLNPSYVNIIIEEACRHIDEEYDLLLFFGFILRWVLRPLENSPWLRKKASIFNSKDKMICSEYVSTCLKKVSLYSCIDPLQSYHPSKITPQMLFDSDLWERWKYGGVFK